MNFSLSSSLRKFKKCQILHNMLKHMNIYLNKLWTCWCLRLQPLWVWLKATFDFDFYGESFLNPFVKIPSVCNWSCSPTTITYPYNYPHKNIRVVVNKVDCGLHFFPKWPSELCSFGCCWYAFFILGQSYELTLQCLKRKHLTATLIKVRLTDISIFTL